MSFKCKHCGWKLNTGSFHTSADQFKSVNDHINNCPVMPFSKVIEEKQKSAREEQ